MKVLHLASFSGNIGDNANHMGFRPWLEAQMGRNLVWNRLEIREFYWRERQWDDTLVEAINRHDLLVIGGGNYFELWVENSPTGTSIAFEPEVLSRIRIPVFFNALGLDPGQGVPEVCRDRFSMFLDTLTGSDQYLVSLRNDGARQNLKTHFGDEHLSRVHELPDHGFFAEAKRADDCFAHLKGRRICVNLASDMAETRFPGFSDQVGFAKEMAASVTRISSQFPDANFIFMPHIFRDLEIVSQTLSLLDDRLRRTRVHVAPYGSGDKAAEAMLAIYAEADLVLGMRFHSNVCPMALGRQVLGLNSYIQIENLYCGLDQSDRLIPVGQPGFSEALVNKSVQVLENPGTFRSDPQDAINQVRQSRSNFERVLASWAGIHFT